MLAYGGQKSPAPRQGAAAIFQEWRERHAGNGIQKSAKLGFQWLLGQHCRL